MFLDDWLRQQFLYSGYAPQAPADPFSQHALASQGGIDPRMWENGTPDFNTTGAQAGLLGAKTLGVLSDPRKLTGLLGMGALLANARHGSAPQPSNFRGHPPMPQGPGASVIAQMYQVQQRDRKKRLPGEDPFGYYETPYDGSY